MLAATQSIPDESQGQVEISDCNYLLTGPVRVAILQQATAFDVAQLAFRDGPAWSRIWVALNIIGRSFSGLGIPDRAEEVLLETENLLADRLKDTASELLWVRAHLAVAKENNSQVAEAVLMLEELQRTWAEKHDINDDGHRFIAGALVTAYQTDSQFEAAVRQAEHVVEVTQVSLGSHHHATRIAKRDYASALASLSRFPEAISHIGDVVDDLRQEGDGESLELMRA